MRQQDTKRVGFKQVLFRKNPEANKHPVSSVPCLVREMQNKTSTKLPCTSHWLKPKSAETRTAAQLRAQQPHRQECTLQPQKGHAPHRDALTGTVCITVLLPTAQMQGRHLIKTEQPWRNAPYGRKGKPRNMPLLSHAELRMQHTDWVHIYGRRKWTEQAIRSQDEQIF